MIQTRSKLLVIAAILVAAISAATKPAKANLHHEEHHCHSSCGTKTVPYPFGFSPECAIQLQCNTTTTTSADITIGEFQVLNITHRGILIHIPAECNRPISKLHSLFNSRYGISSRNNLLLQDCNKSLDSCVMAMRSMEGLINGSSCDDASRSGNLNCYAKGFMQGSSSPVFDTISYDDVNLKECKSVFSSFALSGDMPSLQFQRLELEWWIDGGCSQTACYKDSNCINVTLSNGGIGHRCHCNDGLVGDGFPAGNGCRREERFLSRIAVGATIAGIIVISSTIVFIYILMRKKARKQEGEENINRTAELLYGTEKRLKDMISSEQFKEEDKKGIDVPFFDFESIVAATGNFSDANKLGQGGFGPVYKGTFPGGREMAIKRLSSVSGQGLEEFKNEVVLIAKLQHRNLVRLLGYCIKGDEKLLIYEYMRNRSLDFFIFEHGMVLNWEARFNIILGVARGLLYLHQDSRLRIIHRDLKTGNILLDDEMNPKISDFGLARIFQGKQTEGTTNRVIGTYGYMSPEYALDGLFSVKSDAFSFGVALLEILSGKRNTGYFQAIHNTSLLGYAWRLWTGGLALDLMDEMVRESCDRSEFLKCINVALLCVQDDPADRPTMSNVVAMLSSETSTLPNPKQPAFTVTRCFRDNFFQ